MAVKPRQGTQTWFAVGENLQRGTPIGLGAASPLAAMSVDVVRDGTTGRVTTPGLVKRRFPFNEFAINDTPEVIESTLIRAFGAASPDIFGLFSAAGRMRTGIIPSDMLHLLRGSLNPNAPVVSAKIDNVNVDGDNAAFGSTGVSTTITNIKAVADGNAPSRLEMTFSAAPTAGTVKITGTRKIGRPDNRIHKQRDTEVVTPRAAKVLSSKYWVDIDSIEFNGITAGDLTVTGVWDSGTYSTEMRFNTLNDLFEGWTVIGADGGAPFVAEDVTPIATRFSVTSGGASVDIDVVATLKNELRKIGSTEEQVKFEQEELDLFPISQEREQPGWGSSFWYGGQAVKATGLDVAIALNIESDTEVFDASRYATDIIQTANRVVTFAPTLRFISGDAAADTFQRWQNIIKNDIRSEIIFRSYNYLGDGSRTLFEIKANNAQMNANEVATAGQGPLTRRTGFKALPSTDEASEIVVRTETKEQFSE